MKKRVLWIALTVLSGSALRAGDCRIWHKSSGMHWLRNIRALSGASLENQKNEVVYEWRVENCSGVEDQHELAKYIQGKWSQFRVAYVHKVQQLEAEEREEWLKAICDTKVTIEKDK